MNAMGLIQQPAAADENHVSWSIHDESVTMLRLTAHLVSASIPLPIAYPNGALRITRTPGRKDAKNCVNLRDVIHKDQLESACIYSFFIAEEELYEHLPLSHAPGGIPVRM